MPTNRTCNSNYKVFKTKFSICLIYSTTMLTLHITSTAAIIIHPSYVSFRKYFVYINFVLFLLCIHSTIQQNTCQIFISITHCCTQHPVSHSKLLPIQLSNFNAHYFICKIIFFFLHFKITNFFFIYINFLPFYREAKALLVIN